MFCSGCGAKVVLGSAKCPQCVEVLGFGGSVSAGNITSRQALQSFLEDVCFSGR